MLESQSQGNYRYLAGERGRVPFCNAVIADSGYEIIRASLDQHIPYKQGFQFIESHLKSLGRPRQALCGVELRCAEPYTRDGFNAFNREYAALLESWGLWSDGIGYTARTNIAPALAAPKEQVLFAFSYTVPSAISRPTFILSGAAAPGPESGGPNDFRAKIAHVASVLDARLKELGLGWDDTTEVVAYAPHDVEPALHSEVLPLIGNAVLNGIRWFPSRAPVVDTEIELGAHGVRQEIRVSAK
jgi:hypothetical protein